MSALRKLSLNIPGIIPTLHFNNRIVVGVNLSRYATTVSKVKKQKAKEETKPKSTKSKQEKTKKEPIIPEEPKKPSSPYGIFYSDFYHQEHKKNPENKVTQIAKLAGEKWTQLSEEEKNLYAERHKKKASEFEKTYEKWLNSLTPEQIFQENQRRRLKSKTGKKKIKLIKDPRSPKKPRTPYINFVKERISSSDDQLKASEQIKELAYEWKHLTIEDKKPYMEAYEKDKLRYEKELKEYKNLGKQVK